MTWFLVVVMMGQPNGITPLYVTYKTFEEQDKCIQFAQTKYKIPNTVPNAESKIESSKVTGVANCHAKYGLPLITIG